MCIEKNDLLTRTKVGRAPAGVGGFEGRYSSVRGLLSRGIRQSIPDKTLVATNSEHSRSIFFWSRTSFQKSGNYIAEESVGVGIPMRCGDHVGRRRDTTMYIHGATRSKKY